MGGFAEARGKIENVAGALGSGAALAFVPHPSVIAPGSGTDIRDSC